ncbi:MAG: hypothetical protein ACI4AI_00795 [Paludibacteraceae bacterium]
MRTMMISIFLLGAMMVTAQPQARMSSMSPMVQPQMAGDVVVGMSSSSASGLLFKSKGAVKPAPVKSARSTSMGSGVSGAVFSASSLSSSRAKKASVAGGGGFSGGASAGGLMSSGSKYSSAATNGGGATSVSSGPSTPSGPRRVNGYPNIPFPDPIGDAAWPLALLAGAYLILRIARKRTRALKR